MEAGLNLFAFENNKNCLIESQVPEICKKEPCILGIDEAGRGPVLGPMVYGICYCPESKEDDLKAVGCADSKTLTEEQREALFVKLDQSNDFIGWAVEILCPNFICNNMLRQTKYSLNDISHDSAIGLVKSALKAGVNVTKIYVDTVGPPEKYQAKLSKIFPDIKITVSKKADSLFPIVSAASICAKVARDRAIKGWQYREMKFKDSDIACGSGYPSDPATKKFLAETMDPVFGFPQIVRFSWSTAEQILVNKAVKVEWEESDADNDNSTPSVTNFFAKKPKDETELRHRFFAERQLSVVNKFP